MRRDKETSVNTFTRGIDRDRDLHAMEATFYRDALNVESGYGSVKGAIVTARGNELIQEGEENTSVIGREENRLQNAIVYFVADDDGDNHKILQYKDGVVSTVLMRAFLDFDGDRPIHSARIIDGNLLYFTDGLDYGDGIVGNPPRVVNIERGIVGKLLTHRLIFSNESFEDGAEFSLRLRDYNTGAAGPIVSIHTVSGTVDRNDTIDDLVSAFDANGVTATFPYNTADHPAPYLDLVASVEDSIIEVTGNGHSIGAIPMNYYHYDADERAISLIKPAPLCAPSPVYQKRTDIDRSNLYGHSYIFRCRYVFRDGEKSAWGPSSYVPTNFVVAEDGRIESSEEYNNIHLQFDTEYTNTVYGRSLVKGYEISVRTSAAGVWRMVDYVDLEKVFWNYRYDFQNTGGYPAVPSDENAAVDVQAFKLYDFVPRIVMGLETIYDNRGNSILALGGGMYDYDLPEVVATVGVVASTQASPPDDSQSSIAKCLKSGGIYDVGVVYKDLYGRCSSVVPLGTVRVPFSQQPVGDNVSVYHLTVDFDSLGPDWAEKAQVCLSPNKNQNLYYQIESGNVDYWIYNQEEDELSSTTYNDPAAEYIGFEVDLRDLQGTALDTYIFELLASNDKIFLPEGEDRIQVLAIRQSGSSPSPPYAVAADIETYNYPIAGYRVRAVSDTSKLHILVKLRDGMPRWDYSGIQLVQGYYEIEVYRPRDEVSDDIYYEFGDCIEMESGTHGETSFTNRGDTYSIHRKFNLGAPQNQVTLICPGIQRPTLYGWATDEPNDFGRAVVIDPLYQERYAFDMIRSSDIYIPQSSVNGLSSFRSEDFIRINRAWGPCRKLILNQDVLLAICSSKTQPIYLGKDRVLNLDKNSQLGRSQLLFNLAGETQLDLGTLHSESVLYYQGKTFAYDAIQGVFWRYTSGGGQVRISDKGLINYFKGTSAYYLENGVIGNRVITGVDPSQDSIYISMYDRVLVWKNDDNDERWVSGDMSFRPDAYAHNRSEFFTFKNGGLWRHTDQADRCNFYGVQYGCWIQFVLADKMALQKLLDSIEIHSEGKWYVASIDIPATPSYPEGMRSRIIASKFVYYEGAGKAAFMRDETDPSVRFEDISPEDVKLATARLQGRYLRGEVALVKIQAVNPQDISTLRQVFVNYVFSEQTLNT